MRSRVVNANVERFLIERTGAVRGEVVGNAGSRWSGKKGENIANILSDAIDRDPVWLGGAARRAAELGSARAGCRIACPRIENRSVASQEVFAQITKAGTRALRVRRRI